MVPVRSYKNQLFVATIPWFSSDCLQLPPHSYELMIPFKTVFWIMLAYSIGDETLNIRRFAVNQIWTTILDHIQIPNESLFILYCLLYWPNEARCRLGLRPSRNPNKRPLLVHTACSAIIRLWPGRSRKTITIHHHTHYLMALLSPPLRT